MMKGVSQIVLVKIDFGRDGEQHTRSILNSAFLSCKQLTVTDLVMVVVFLVQLHSYANQYLTQITSWHKSKNPSPVRELLLPNSTIVGKSVADNTSKGVF